MKINLPTRSAAPKVRIFQGEFSTFANFISPAGKVVGFYKGVTTSNDPEVCDYVLTLDTVKEVTDVKGFVVPTPPTRTRSRNWASAGPASDPVSISHLELLQRAVASSDATPQAAESTSTS